MLLSSDLSLVDCECQFKIVVEVKVKYEVVWKVYEVLFQIIEEVVFWWEFVLVWQ